VTQPDLPLGYGIDFGTSNSSVSIASSFSFLGPLGTVPAYNMPLEFRLLLALPVAAAGLGIAALAQVLDRWLPRARESWILTPIYGFLTVIACIGLLVLPLKATLLVFGR
jgi:hypothetical protein